MSLAADPVLSVTTRFHTTTDKRTTSHNGRNGPTDVPLITNNKASATTGSDEDLTQLAWQEDCDLTRAGELFTKDVGDTTETSSKASTSGRHSSEQDADIDKILSDELEKLTVDEREQIAYDVHGLLHAPQGDPVDVDSRLMELEQEIRKIRNRKDYEKAKYLNESYVTERSFRLKFLRCDHFDVQLAAQRVVKHFEIKRELFGDKCLARQLRMSDLTEDDVAVLNSGFFHLLPSRDVAGRLVVVIDAGLRPDVPISNVVRASWFFFDSFSRDESYQQKGIVIIAVGIENGFRKLTLVGMNRFARARTGMPRKVASLHCCFDNPAWRPVVASIRLVARRDARNRFISHFGDKQSLSFQLQTYGIATDDMFASSDEAGNNANLEWHRQWLQIMKAREETQSSPRDDIIIPLRFDVLFGRGKNTREHTGNLRALHLCEMVRPQYEAAGKFEKTAIAERIVHAIRESHGRFLKWEDDGWVEVDTEAAREKISHFFRHHRSKKGTSTSGTSSGTQTKRKPSDDSSDVVSDGVESLEARDAKQPYRWNVAGSFC